MPPGNPHNFRLHESIITPDLYRSPQSETPEPAAGAPDIELAIIGSRHVRVGETVLELETSHEIFAFNSLLLRAHGVTRTSSDLFELGYRYQKEYLVRALGAIAGRLNEAAGTTIVEQAVRRKSKTFQLRGEVGADWDLDKTYTQVPLTVPKKRAAKNAFARAASGEIREGDLDARSLAIMEVVARYKADERVALRLARHRKGTAPGAPADQPANSRWVAHEFEPPATPDEEKKLVQALEDGIAALQASKLAGAPTAGQMEAMLELTATYQYLFASCSYTSYGIARQYAQISDMAIEDLFHAGLSNNARVICYFDPGKGMSFKSYAYESILASIRRAIADESRTIRLPSGHHELWLKIHKERRVFFDIYGREIGIDVLAKRLDKPVAAIELIMQRGSRTASLEFPLGEGDGSVTLGDVIEDERDTSYEQIIDSTAYRTALEKILPRLQERGSKSAVKYCVLFLHYGLMLPDYGGYFVEIQGETQTIAQVMERARQIYGEGSLSFSEIDELMGWKSRRAGLHHHRALEILSRKVKAR